MSHKGMHSVKAVLAVFLLLTTVVGCSTLRVEPSLKFNALVIQNNSDMVLEDVRIKVEKTGALASCSVILPGSSCSTSFSDKPYRNNPVYISWSHNGQSRVVGPVMVEPPKEIHRELSASALLEFGSHEQVSARFVY